MQPKAYNWWEGNTFRIPGLPVRPTYAPALSPQASDPTAGTAADTLAQLGFRMETGGIGEGMGRNESSLGASGAPGSPNAGMGPGAQVTSLGDMMGRVGTGVGMVTGLPGFALGIGSLAGPTPKTEYSLRDLLPGNSLFDMIGGSGTNGGPSLGPGSGLSTQSPVDLGMPGFGNNETSGGGGYSDGGYSSAPSEADRNAADTLGDTGMYNRGGKVKALFGPNPPGPDDGFGGLQRGERVIPKAAVAKLEAKHGTNLFDQALNKGRLPPARGRR